MNTNKTLEKKYQYLEYVLSILPGHIYWKDSNGVYLGCNDAQAKTLNFNSGKEVIGKKDSELSWGGSESFLEIDQKVMRTQQDYVVEEPVISEGNNEVIYLSRKSPLFDPVTKEIVGIVGVSFDITDRKKIEDLERKLALVNIEYLNKALEVAEAKNKTIKTLAGSISHELRTPLCSSSMALARLEQYLPTLIQAYEKTTEIQPNNSAKLPKLRASELSDLKQIVAQLKNNNTDCQQIVNMQLKNIQADEINQTNFQKCSAKTIITAAISKYPFTDNKLDIIEFNPSELDDFEFFGDPILTRHIFWNLIKNALFYIERARKGNITISLAENKNEYIIYFTDTSTGIPEHLTAKIFEQFYTERNNGTGLGLSFCKLVMESYQGNITCQSVLGEYTQFTLTFPKTTLNMNK